MADLTPLDLSHRHRRFWHFLHMRMLRKSDIIYRNYDLLARMAGDSASDLRWSGFLRSGEQMPMALKRLHHLIWAKYDRRLTDVALMQIVREFVIWESLHSGLIKGWPTRHRNDIQRLNDEDRAARKQAGAP